MSWVGGWVGPAPAHQVDPPAPPQPPQPVPIPVVHGDPEYLDYVASSLDRLCEQFKGDPEDLPFPEYSAPSTGEPPDAFPYVSTEGGSGTEESPYLIYGLVVPFLDASTSPTTIVAWLWDFGDGESSTEQNPEHEYAEEGVYLVTLTVTNTGGASDSGTCYVGLTGET